MSEETAGDYQPVNQLYTQKIREDGAASSWRVDTTLIRQFLENKIKGIEQLEVEYKVYTLLDDKSEVVSTFLAKNNREALSNIAQYAEMQDIDVRQVKYKLTGEVETKIEPVRIKTPLLPDDVCDVIFSCIEAIFSQVGYLTKYSDEDIKNEIYGASSIIRQKLLHLYHTRKDLDPSNLELVVNMIKTMIKLVLKASEDGWTGNQLSSSVQEKVITHTNDPKKVMGFGG